MTQTGSPDPRIDLVFGELHQFQVSTGQRLPLLSRIAIEHCASAKPMRFARSIFRPIGLPKVQTFECRKCGLAITAEAAAEVLETTVQFMPA
jgi:hypothetical protein